jgi:pimeloyl-ACP methyl ester carboxylesterase
MAGTAEIDFEWRDLVLSGTLHRPDGLPHRPAIVLMQGSGPADRDADGYFAEIRRPFLDRGIAVYAFDKPGCGRSAGDWRHHGLFDRADQVVAALEAVRSDDGVDPDRVGVWGQSQGGWMAQLVAAGAGRPAFAVSNSGPSMGVREQNLYGCEHTMRADGHPESEIAAALEFIEVLYAAAERNAPWDEVAGIVESIDDAPWYGYLTVDDELDWEFGRILLEEDYQPVPTIARVSCPFLAIFGGRDVLGPAWQGADEVGRALQEAPTTDASVVVFPDADHRIRLPDGGFAPGYLDLLGDWVASRVR